MVFIELDDLLVAASSDYMKKLREAVHKRFIFGKLVEPRSSVTFDGRTLEIRSDHIGVHFEKYILFCFVNAVGPRTTSAMKKLQHK